jgi:hypothetical protein
MRIIFTRIGCTLLTCDMYMSDLRHKHDPVISSLKMKGIHLLYFCSLFPYPPPITRAPIRAYVKRMKDNEMRHMIHYTRVSSGQCTRRDVTVRCGLQGHTKKTNGKTYTCQNSCTYGQEPRLGEV